MLRLQNISTGYGDIAVLKNVSLHIGRGEIVTLIGANGAGKTTLLHTITGLIKSTAGEVVLKGKSIARTGPDKIVFLGCSLVPEGRQVFATMTVKENLTLGAYVQYKKNKDTEDWIGQYGIFIQMGGIILSEDYKFKYIK